MEKPADPSNLPGLSDLQASQKLQKDGYNELPSQKQKSFFTILLEVFKEPMFLLLLITSIIYLLIGDIKDSLMLVAFVNVIIGITIYQEYKTEKALDSLKNLSSPRALVIRNGKQKRISGREVVVGDIIILRDGDRVPADAIVYSAVNLSVDESLLTGESIAVRKSSWDGKETQKRPGGNDLPFVFSGTLIVSGRGIARITSTGINTQMGKIGKALQTIKEEDTLLQKETGKIVKNFALAGLFLCLIVIIVYGISTNSWLKGFLAGLTLGMSMIPEEFSVVLILFLTLGAWRMSKHQVLTRKTSAIETLGAATVLCVDKTGTLTQNKMELSSLMVDQDFLDIKNQSKIPEKFHALIEYSVLASQTDPFDPIEKEIKFKGETYLKSTEHIHQNWKLVKEYPLHKSLLALSHVWISPDKNNYVIATKGAPEAIADLCHMTQDQKLQLHKNIIKLAEKGLRVLGVAKASFDKNILPNKQHDFDFKFLGLVGFIDPIRETVPQAVTECYDAGLKIVMITGDYPQTAVHIAKEIKLKNPNEVITGSQLESMSHLKLRDRIKTCNIFARVVPEQKLQIVNALKANDEIVAMTGDGVNDAPALKAAHIGIAMGERGTDVARESAALVLLKDDFLSIVQSIKMGRRIFDNLKKAMSFIFAVHIPIAGMSLLPILFKMPMVLLPAHIAFLELIIDPSCTIVFENVHSEGDIMKRPPRNLYEPLFSKRNIILAAIQGLSVLAIVFIFYSVSLSLGLNTGEARSFAFVTLVFANLTLIITNLSLKENLQILLSKKNNALWLVLGGTLFFLTLIIFVPFLQNLFYFNPITIFEFIMALTGSILCLFWFEGLKFVNFKYNKT